MREEEQWKGMYEFPEYQVSNMGRVARIGSDKPMSVHYTQFGHAKLNLMDLNHERRTRSVALLVAKAFVHRPFADCEHVIVLNGDLSDVRASNLAWRPEGYAWTYTNQYKVPQPLYLQNLPVDDIVHHHSYPNIVEAAAHQGLLFQDIWHSTYTGDQVYPTGSIFRVRHGV